MIHTKYHFEPLHLNLYKGHNTKLLKVIYTVLRRHQRNLAIAMT